ncbi:hypothetical protein RY831_15590 [Noviherbaspirillum sp. CPCC 100848]|uniref:Uncharacterized protein n=1 Tax=Noviherbaspirillum album TaxID=3080276 RepID=A0ABU6JAA7_9BURK|nr:hypothetical protein [Noviherbaspirillum sp. CPCC 100848]MEC4720586.1 hypothetical protein [Noviherbaspirillum sp. CPCC 100848]
MHSPKNFLLLECESVRSVLQETLRYEYGIEGSRAFFEECEVRLDFIKQQLCGCLDDDHDALANTAALLTELSELIAHIERSSIGEYSWPFVEELKVIAEKICTETTITNPHTPPKVHVISGGGLDKYAIDVEQKRPAAAQRRILTIIFPRSFKHLVLLHPVLGHELGHAIWRGSEHEKRLQQIIYDNLLDGNPKFVDEAATAAWLYSPDAPQGIKDTLNWYATNWGLNQSNFFQEYASLAAWIEELTCDLIGLTTFGPSFVAALWQLLSSLMPSGNNVGDEHPPTGCRINLMLSAIRVLGYDKLKFENPDIQKEFDDFWSTLHSYKRNEPWYDLFSDAQILKTVNELQVLLKAHPPACYETPDAKTLAKLYCQVSTRVAPSGFEMSDEGKPICEIIDFRHILFAGWIASRSIKEISFDDINRLCEHAILQQRAIKLHAE